MRGFRELLIVGLLAASCRFQADYGGTAYSCKDGRCPAGFQCVAQRCVAPGNGDADLPADGSGDATSPDASCICQAKTEADSCMAADLVDLDQAGAPGGQTVCASTELNSNALLGCTAAPFPGNDAVYRVQATSGQTITAQVRPDGFDASIYVVPDCSSTSCLGQSDAAGVGGTETTSASAPSSADYFVVVDSATGGSGCYQLNVQVQ